MKTYSFDDLKDKVCVITGGGGVIGKSLVKAIATTGAKIAILDLFKDLADKAAAEICDEVPGATVIGVEANVLEKESLIWHKGGNWGPLECSQKPVRGNLGFKSHQTARLWPKTTPIGEIAE